jgi:hypothetical protein
LLDKFGGESEQREKFTGAVVGCETRRLELVTTFKKTERGKKVMWGATLTLATGTTIPGRRLIVPH